MFESLARKPKDWASHAVPEKLFNEWLSLPGLEHKMKAEKARHGLQEDGDIIILAGSASGGFQEVWFHPIAAHEFGFWYAKHVSGERHPSLYGLVYAAFYDNGLVKVGMTACNAETRLSNHDSTMRITGAARTEALTMVTKTPAQRVEQRLLRLMGMKHERRGGEWFVGADPSDVLAMMSDCVEEDLHDWCQSANVKV